MILPAQERAARLAIHRMGVECDISEPAGSTATDGYGKQSSTDDTFSSVGSEKVVRVYGGGGTEPSVGRHTGGRQKEDSPLLVLQRNTVAQEGFRVSYNSSLYELDSFTIYPSHIEATTTLVN